MSKNSWNLRVFRVNIFRPYNIFFGQISYLSAQNSLWVWVWVAEPVETDICFLCIFQGIENDTAGNLQEFQAIWKSSTQKKCENNANTIKPRIHWQGVVILNQTSDTKNCRGLPMLIVKHHYCAQMQWEWTVKHHSALRRIRI